MLKIEVKGLDELRRNLAEFSDRRFGAAVATALTRTAKQMQVNWQGQINSRIEGPITATQRAVGFVSANAQKLEARVFVKGGAESQANQAQYLAPQEEGGSRLIKKFERALISAGAMPSGYITVPGRHAARDRYGNVTRSLITAVIAQLGRDFSPGYQRTISKSLDKRLARQKKLGKAYVAISPAQAMRANVSPGIYERMPDGSRKAVFLFKRAAFYQRRLDLIKSAESETRQIMSAELSRAIDASMARLRARG